MVFGSMYFSPLAFRNKSYKFEETQTHQHMKKTLLYAAALLMSATTIAQIPTSGLVAHYPFNGNANDESGNSNDGTVNGATLTNDRFGNANSAYLFDGTDDIIEVLRSSSIEPASSISISLWALIDSSETGNFERILSKQHSQDQNYSSYQIIVGNVGQGNLGKPGFTVRTSTSYKWTGHSTSETIQDWTHLVGVYDGSDIKFYHDGILVSSVAHTGTFVYDSNSLLIGGGKDGLGFDSFFKGEIDDIRIYNNAISATDVQSLYNESVCKVTVTDTLVISLSDIITTVHDPSKVATTVKVFPNPTAGNLTVEIDNYTNLSGVTIKVLDAQSAEVHNEAVTSSTQSIDLSGWSAGVYFLHVMNGSTTVDVKKIVVNN